MIENLTVLQIFQAITPTQLAGLITCLSATFVAAFVLGFNWEKRLHAIALLSATEKLEAVSRREGPSADALRNARMKMRFLQLSTALQFAAIERRVSVRRLFEDYPSAWLPDEGFMISSHQAEEMYRAYTDVVIDLLNPGDGTEPLAYREVQRVGPGPMRFADDGSKWLLIANPAEWAEP